MIYGQAVVYPLLGLSSLSKPQDTYEYKRRTGEKMVSYGLF